MNICNNVTIGAASLFQKILRQKVFIMALQRKKLNLLIFKINKIYKNKIIKGINSIIENSEFINGSNVKEFEKEFAKIIS